MNRYDIEKYLSRFKINEPGPDLKYKVLLRAKAAWAEARKPAAAYPVGFRLRWNYVYIFAGVILLGVITLSIEKPMPGKLTGGKPAISKYTEEKILETKISPAAKNTTRIVKNERGAVRNKPEPEITKYIENDSQMKDLYTSLGIDYKGRQLYLSLSQSLHRKSEFRDEIEALLKQQQKLLSNELES